MNQKKYKMFLKNKTSWLKSNIKLILSLKDILYLYFTKNTENITKCVSSIRSLPKSVRQIRFEHVLIKYYEVCFLSELFFLKIL